MLRRELLVFGLDDRAIARRVKSGDLHRVRHGAYVDGPAWRSADGRTHHQLRARAVVRQRRAPLVISHLSALVEWRAPLWDIDITKVNVTRNDRRGGRQEAGVRQHYGVLRAEDVCWLNGVRVTAAARTVLDAMTVLDVEHGLVVTNDFLHRGLVDNASLARQSEVMAGWPNSLHKNVVLRLADGSCESVGESRVLYACWRTGMPAPVAQYVVKDASGSFVARVDFAWPERGVFLEFDGRVKYQGSVAGGESATAIVLREKRREDRIVAITGWRCLRVSWHDLDHPEQLARRLRALFDIQEQPRFRPVAGAPV